MNNHIAHPDWNLVHVNVGRLRSPLDHPSMADFSASLHHINQIGWHHPGFFQHILAPDGSPRFHPFADPLIIMNMTVWRSLDSLRDFTYNSHHVDFFRRRHEWFIPLDFPSLALWYIPTGTEPTPEDAKHRLALIATHGPTPLAFTFTTPFTIKQMLATPAPA